MAQKTIKNYFQPLNKLNQTMKKTNCSESNLSVREPSLKKIKISSPKKSSGEKVASEKQNHPENLSPEKENHPTGQKERLPITPDEKLKIEANKLKAQIKLQCTRTPALHENIGVGWFQALKPEFSKTYFQNLSTYQKCEREKYSVYPLSHQVYSWTHYCDIKDIKVVILGQDPYHGVGQAHGLCFSVPNGISPPPSLVNMYKELENDVSGFKHPGHGYLVGWAKQGVLLLNACLTVRAHNANSHKDKGWEQLTDAVIKTISTYNCNVVFLLWGSYAQKKASVVDKKKHHLLHAPHPSPLSAHRGFFGCNHFSKCNDLLVKNGKSPINWCHLPPQL